MIVDALVATKYNNDEDSVANTALGNTNDLISKPRGNDDFVFVLRHEGDTTSLPITER